MNKNYNSVSTQPVPGFRMAPGWRLFGLLISIVFFGVSAYLIVRIARNPVFGKENAIYAAVTAVLFLLGITVLINRARLKIEIHSDSLRYRSLFRFRLFPYDQLKGFRIKTENGFDTLYLYFENRRRRRKRIDMIFENRETLLKLLRQRVYDFDLAETIEHEEAITRDDSLTATEEEGAEVLKKYLRLTNWLNFGIAAFAVWFFFAQHPHPVFYYIFLFLPALLILLMAANRKRIYLTSERPHNLPHLSYALCFSSGALLLRYFTYENIRINSRFLLFTGGFALGIMILLILIRPKATMKRERIVAILIISLFYATGLTPAINHLFDSTPGSSSEYTVVEKKKLGGKTHNVELDLKPVEGESGNLTYTEPGARLSGIETGDRLVVHRHAGRLGIPWIKLEQQEGETESE